MPSWPPTTHRTEPGDVPMPPAPEGVIDVTPETLGDRSAVTSINEFKARLEAQRQTERAMPSDDEPPPRAA